MERHASWLSAATVASTDDLVGALCHSHSRRPKHLKGGSGIPASHESPVDHKWLHEWHLVLGRTA